MSTVRQYIPEPGDEPTIYTPSSINKLVKETLTETYPEVWVEGEISNYKHHTSGHRYFALKDENASVRAVMWRSIGEYLKFQPENGLKVRACGAVTLYEKSGDYQISVKKLLPVGAGELDIAFRQLYARFEAEGLFDPERKRPLPTYGAKIGIVTSPTGAALRDIIHVAGRRNNTIALYIYPAQVQGDGAEDTIARGIAYFNSRSDIDALIVGRGGGSVEDLWAFNTETVVRAIANSRIPVISAVGHEVDWTLADHVADCRAATPSAAAEIIAWEKQAAVDNVAELRDSLRESLSDIVTVYQEKLENIVGRGVFAEPYEIVNQRQQSLDVSWSRFSMASRYSFGRSQSALSLHVGRLDSLSPLRTLARGYAVARHLDKDGRSGTVVTSAAQTRVGDNIEVVLSKGTLCTSVTQVSE